MSSFIKKNHRTKQSYENWCSQAKIFFYRKLIEAVSPLVATISLNGLKQIAFDRNVNEMRPNQIYFGFVLGSVNLVRVHVNLKYLKWKFQINLNRTKLEFLKYLSSISWYSNHFYRWIGNSQYLRQNFWISKTKVRFYENLLNFSNCLQIKCPDKKVTAAVQ